MLYFLTLGNKTLYINGLWNLSFDYNLLSISFFLYIFVSISLRLMLYFLDRKWNIVISNDVIINRLHKIGDKCYCVKIVWRTSYMSTYTSLSAVTGRCPLCPLFDTTSCTMCPVLRRGHMKNLRQLKWPKKAKPWTEVMTS